MKKLISLTLCLLLCLGLALTVHAAEYPPVFDQAELLSDSDAQWLSDLIREVSEKHAIDIVILTVPSLNGESVENYAVEFYDGNGYREDGVIFMISMEERDYAISRSGKLIELLTDDVLDNMENSFLPYLSSGEYYDAFQDFVIGLDVQLTDDPVGDALVCIFYGCIAGLIVAAIALLIMRSGMNTKVQQHSAEDYLKEGSYNLKRTQDIFLYSQVTKHRKPENNNNGGGGGGSTVHSSSTGRTHSTRTGKF